MTRISQQPNRLVFACGHSPDYQRQPNYLATMWQTFRCLSKWKHSRDPLFIHLLLWSSLSYIFDIFGGWYKQGDGEVVKDGGAKTRLGAFSLIKTISALCDITTPLYIVCREVQAKKWRIVFFFFQITGDIFALNMIFWKNVMKHIAYILYISSLAISSQTMTKSAPSL